MLDISLGKSSLQLTIAAIGAFGRHSISEPVDTFLRVR